MRGRVHDRTLHRAWKRLEAPVVSFVRRVLGCPRCELCDVLVRRYRPDERRAVPVHRDINAFATARPHLGASNSRPAF